jgi:hypothetical protein
MTTENVKLTISIKPEVRELFRELARNENINVSKCVLRLCSKGLENIIKCQKKYQ